MILTACLHDNCWHFKLLVISNIFENCKLTFLCWPQLFKSAHNIQNPCVYQFTTNRDHKSINNKIRCVPSKTWNWSQVCYTLSSSSGHWILCRARLPFLFSPAHSHLEFYLINKNSDWNELYKDDGIKFFEGWWEKWSENARLNCNGALYMICWKADLQRIEF